MSHQHPVRSGIAHPPAWLCAAATVICAVMAASTAATVLAQSPPASASHLPPSSTASPVVLDRVVAVVNKQVILASDLDQDIRLSVLEPGRSKDAVLTPQRALQQLISRTLIEQQIRQEDAGNAAPSPAAVNARLTELRKDLPVCARWNCASAAGWRAFLAAHGLTTQQVDEYLRARIEILHFIEQRFRPGIRISARQIAAYYSGTLLPQYPKGRAAPSLQQVKPRIEEILLERQVNLLFGNWLANLRKQGDVEILDPALEAPETQAEAAEGGGR